METTPTIPNLFSVKGFSKKYPTFTEASLRWLIFNGHGDGTAKPHEKHLGNGLEASGAIVRVGRRVYIDEVQFFAWVKNSQRAR